ncbi:hypothetical protein R3P38DRAFT_1377599 [Favolaschia claudopus]|uniref:Uncharacterized protein n=1 Tax=Favolaschia claudopus TaxID=2862362 RepID=A0AAW0DTV9_9AGAR
MPTSLARALNPLLFPPLALFHRSLSVSFFLHFHTLSPATPPCLHLLHLPKSPDTHLPRFRLRTRMPVPVPRYPPLPPPLTPPFPSLPTTYARSASLTNAAYARTHTARLSSSALRRIAVATPIPIPAPCRTASLQPIPASLVTRSVSLLPPPFCLSSLRRPRRARDARRCYTIRFPCPSHLRIPISGVAPAAAVHAAPIDEEAARTSLCFRALSSSDASRASPRSCHVVDENYRGRSGDVRERSREEDGRGSGSHASDGRQCVGAWMRVGGLSGKRGRRKGREREEGFVVGLVGRRSWGWGREWMRRIWLRVEFGRTEEAVRRRQV